MKSHHYSSCLLKLLYLTHISMSFDDFATPDLDGGRFSNPKSFTNWTGVPGLWSLMKWKLCETDVSDVPTDEEFLNSTIPVHPLKNFESQAKLYASWLGHATVLVGLDGAKFITDPVWSQRASPVSFNGPLRYRPPPMLIEDVPELDFGVISHDHYDHLDVDAVKKLSEQSPRMRWFVPLGMEEWMRSVGIMNTDEQSDRVVQMNWGESRTITIRDQEYTIWCLPAQHWCQRGAFDRNKRLWSGWAVVGPTKKFYYTGDTGNCDSEFDKIGKNLGPFDLCAIPIGAYEPRWFMKSQHIGPVEAFQIHETVKSKFSIGIHWGTYHMGSYEFYLRPKQWIEELSKESKNSSGTFTTIEMGKVWEDLA